MAQEEVRLKLTKDGGANPSRSVFIATERRETRDYYNCGQNDHLSHNCTKPRREMRGRGEALAEVDPIEEEEGATQVAPATLAAQVAPATLAAQVALATLLALKQILQLQKKEHQLLLKGSQKGKTRRRITLGTSLTLPTPMKVMLQMHLYSATDYIQN
jgi:hypothetical protein